MAIKDITQEVREMRDRLAVYEATDNINHPKHYNASPAHCECGRRIECIDITRHMNFNIGNVIKYLWRAAFKNGLEDMKKAQWYLNDAIKTLEKQDGDRRGSDDYTSKDCGSAQEAL